MSTTTTKSTITREHLGCVTIPTGQWEAERSALADACDAALRYHATTTLDEALRTLVTGHRALAHDCLLIELVKFPILYMSGAIAIGRKLLPEARFIVTVAGGVPDMVYRLDAATGEWTASHCGLTMEQIDAITRNEKTPAADREVLGYSDFIRRYAKGPEWLLAGLMQKGWLYALTGKWGHGKTAIALTLALHIASGTPFMGRQVRRSKVLYWAGENPGDVALRLPATCKALGIDPALLEGWIDFVPFAFTLGDIAEDELSETAQEVVAQAGALGSELVLVDTGIAYAGLDDENDNPEMHRFAKMLRMVMAELDGATVMALMHPPKDSTRETVTVRGGGAFLGEIDGEMLVWHEAGTRKVEVFHRQKWRGPSFDPIFFDLKTLELPFKDNFGEEAVTVAAVPTTERPIALPKANAKYAWAALRALLTLGCNPMLKEPIAWGKFEERWAGEMKLSSVDAQARRYLKQAIEELGKKGLVDYRDVGKETGTVKAGPLWLKAREAGAF